MRTRFALVLLAFAVTVVSARGETVAEILLTSSGEATDVDPMDHDLLVWALNRAGLLGVLHDVGDDDEERQFTLWAPNDRAFTRFARERGYRGRYDETDVRVFLEENVSRGELGRLLRYHITEARITPLELYLHGSAGLTLPTMLGVPIRPGHFALRDGASTTPDAHLVYPVMLDGENGIVRSLDRVMLPSDS